MSKFQKENKLKNSIIPFILGVFLTSLIFLTYFVANNKFNISSEASGGGFGFGCPNGTSYYNGSCRDGSEINSMMNAVQAGYSLKELRDMSSSGQLSDWKDAYNQLQLAVQELAKCSPKCSTSAIQRVRTYYDYTHRR